MTSQHSKSKQIREFILSQVSDHPKDVVGLAAKRFRITRQAIHRHIRHLIDKGLLEAEGNTRNRTYREAVRIRRRFKTDLTADLQEDAIWRNDIRPLLAEQPSNVLSICEYGLTEIVNNAVDHSGGSTLTIDVSVAFSWLQIAVTDDGVGIFHKIQEEFGLDNPRHAILELSKGKLTTDPERHTGEGIFFASRMFDEFVIGSSRLRFIHFAEDRDFLVERGEIGKGSVVLMKITTNSTRTVQDVFDRYTIDYGFERTVVPVELVRYGEENLVSRSQAKRLLARLDRFREIWLDFNDVSTIGQAFADEIFRVYQNQHPDLKLVVLHANKNVDKMIQKALRN